MQRYKLTLGYDGSGFAGWQKQFPHVDVVPHAPKLDEDQGLMRLGLGGRDAAEKSMADVNFGLFDADAIKASLSPRPRVELRTVQSVLERAVRHVVRQPVSLTGASRTDSGVHARGQVASFTCTHSQGREGGWPEDRGTEGLRRAINDRLPDDVLVSHIERVPEEWHVVGDVERKEYTYRFWSAEERPLWERPRVMHVREPLDAEAMDRAAKHFEGEHDFAAFAAAGHGRLSTVRKVFSCRIARASQEAPELVMAIEGNGFLLNMVRIIAGTLVEIGKGKMDPARIHEGFATGNRRLAGPTVPPTGLCLEWIKYRDGAGLSSSAGEQAWED